MSGIQVTIGANTEQLDRAVTKSRAQITQLTNELKKGIQTTVKYGAAAAAAGAAIGAKMVSNSLKAVDALAKTSDKLGIATEDLLALRHAAELTGVQTNQLEMGLQRMTRRVAEAAQGSGEAKDAIRQLGLDAQQLAQLSPDQQFKQIAEAMSGVSSQGERVRLAFKLFDSEGVNLVNTLALGAEGLNEVQQELVDFGGALTRVDAAKIEAANDAFTRVGLGVDAVSNQMAVELAPILEATANLFVANAKEAGGFESSVKDAMDEAIDGAAFVMDAVAGVSRMFDVAGKGAAVFALVLKRAALDAAEAIINDPVEALNLLISAFNRIPGIDIEPVGISSLGKEIREELAITNRAITEGLLDIHGVLAEPLPGVEFKQMIKETREMSQQAAEEIANSKKLIDSAIGEGGIRNVNTQVNQTVKVNTNIDYEVGDISSFESDLHDQIEAIRQAGMTQQQILVEQRELRNAKAKSALAQELVTQKEYQALMLESRRLFEEEMANANPETGELIDKDSSAGEEDDQRGDGGRFKERLNQQLEAIRQAGMTEQEILAEQRDIKQAEAEAAFAQQLITQEEYQALMLQSKQAFEEGMSGLTKKENDARLSVIKGALSNASTLMNTESRKLFEIGKAAAIAQSIVATYQGMSEALKLGWPLGPIAAASIGAQGFAQVASIKSQSFGSSGGGAAAPAQQSQSVTQNVNAQSQPVQQPQNQIVSINLEGEVFGRDQVRGLIGQINEALDDGYTLRV
jgi:hypothetical protein